MGEGRPRWPARHAERSKGSAPPVIVDCTYLGGELLEVIRSRAGLHGHSGWTLGDRMTMKKLDGRGTGSEAVDFPAEPRPPSEREAEMRERLTHLTRVSTMGEMASSIAHEVNQPLTAIATYAQACRRMLAEGETSLSEVADVLGRISDEALRAGNIVHRLKDLVRRQETRWVECDVNALVRDVEQLASVDARLHDVALRFELAPELPHVLADAVQVQQVVLNLIRNGIDAVEERDPPVREVVVRTGPEGPREVRVSVQDQGCGLPEELEKRLFQPFFTTKKEGMGMGLSISRSIASLHRGRISFARNRDGGVTFHFILPILDDA